MFMNSEYKPYLENKLFKIRNSKFLFIEDLWENPNLIVNLIAKFLNTKKTTNTEIMLKVRITKKRNQRNL